MPSTLNGVGTWYYGKSNYSRRAGTCQFCKRQTNLEDYDTRLFFVILFIPIIPLKRVHVMNKCRRCTKHQTITGAKWDELQAKIENAVEAADKSPRDEKLAIEVLGACVTLRDVARLNKIGPEYETRFAANPRMLSLVAEAYYSFGRTPDAERVLQAAVAKSDEPQPHEALGRILARTNRPAEAQPHLQHIIDDNVAERVDDIYELAQSYQRVGQHADAVAMFDACRQIFPKVEENATFRKFRAASESLINTTKPVDGVKMLQGERNRAKGKKFLRVALAVVLLGGATYVAWALIAGYRTEVFLVNGLDRQYTAMIEGKLYVLPARSTTAAYLSVGNHFIDLPDLGISPRAAINIRRPFWSRPFSGEVFVINPDRGAIIIKSEVVYAQRGSGQAHRRAWLSGGHVFQIFGGIDYQFTPPPREMSLSTPSEQVSKMELQLLQQVQPLPPATLVSALRREAPASDAVEFTKAQATYGGNSDEYASELFNLLPAAELVTFFHDHLSEHPDDVGWNRSYVNAMSRVGREQDAANEYEKRLKEDPANRLNQFFAAIATHEPARYLELMKKAAAEPDGVAAAHSRLCGYYASIGENHLAAQEADIASKALPNDAETRYYATSTYIADRQYDKALKLSYLEQATPAPRNLIAIRTTTWLLKKVGRSGDVATQSTLLANVIRQYSAPQQQTVQARYDGYLAYEDGNPSSAASTLRLSNDPSDRFAADIITGDVRAAADELTQTDAPELKDSENQVLTELMLYIAAAKSEPAIAKAALEKGIELIRTGDYEDRLYAEALSGKSAPPDEVLTHLRDAGVRRRIFLTAIGLANPARASACFAMVRKINDDPTFPKLLLEKAIGN